MLNLLPQSIKDQHRQHSLVYSLSLVYIIILTIIGLSIVGLVTYNLASGATIAGRQDTVESLEARKQQKKATIDKAVFIEDRLQAAAKFQETRDWPQVLALLAAAVPAEIKLTEIAWSHNPSGPALVTIGAQATERRAIILFKEKLSQAKELASVELSSLTDNGPTAPFSFTLAVKLQDDAFKK